MNHSATIVAIITPPGKGAVAGIRLSGKEALSIANEVFSKNILSPVSHKALYGEFIGKTTRKVIDQVLLLPMRGPNSYTGEDIVEIFCHGSPVITKKIVHELVECGATPAKGGEFTFRAFQNGKIDLMQAEAVQSLISSENALAASCAKDHLEGALSKKIGSFQTALTDIGAVFAAAIDFPEEGLSFATSQEIKDQIRNIFQEMQELLSSFQDGKKIREGASFCLIGAPNAGKSSLLNTLLRKERAIVTSAPGTTRDFIEEKFVLGAHHFALIDTAGIREGLCPIEKEGIRRSKEAAQKADFHLLVIDGSSPKSDKVLSLLEQSSPEKTILVWNKADLAKPSFDPRFPYQLYMSAKTGEGLATLENLFKAIAWENPPESYPLIITEKRHQTCLQDAISCLETVLAGLEGGMSFEFLGVDLQDCLNALARLIGTNVTEDLLSSIFSQFCVGK